MGKNNKSRYPKRQHGRSKQVSRHSYDSDSSSQDDFKHYRQNQNVSYSSDSLSAKKFNQKGEFLKVEDFAATQKAMMGKMISYTFLQLSFVLLSFVGLYIIFTVHTSEEADPDATPPDTARGVVESYLDIARKYVGQFMIVFGGYRLLQLVFGAVYARLHMVYCIVLLTFLVLLAADFLLVYLDALGPSVQLIVALSAFVLADNGRMLAKIYIVAGASKPLVFGAIILNFIMNFFFLAAFLVALLLLPEFNKIILYAMLGVAVVMAFPFFIKFGNDRLKGFPRSGCNMVFFDFGEAVQLLFGAKWRALIVLIAHFAATYAVAYSFPFFVVPFLYILYESGKFMMGVELYVEPILLVFTCMISLACFNAMGPKKSLTKNFVILCIVAAVAVGLLLVLMLVAMDYVFLLITCSVSVLAFAFAAIPLDLIIRGLALVLFPGRHAIFISILSSIASVGAIAASLVTPLLYINETNMGSYILPIAALVFALVLVLSCGVKRAEEGERTLNQIEASRSALRHEACIDADGVVDEIETADIGGSSFQRPSGAYSSYSTSPTSRGGDETRSGRMDLHPYAAGFHF